MGHPDPQLPGIIAIRRMAAMGRMHRFNTVENVLLPARVNAPGF